MEDTSGKMSQRIPADKEEKDYSLGENQTESVDKDRKRRIAIHKGDTVGGSEQLSSPETTQTDIRDTTETEHDIRNETLHIEQETDIHKDDKEIKNEKNDAEKSKDSDKKKVQSSPKEKEQCSPKKTEQSLPVKEEQSSPRVIGSVKPPTEAEIPGLLSMITKKDNNTSTVKDIGGKEKNGHPGKEFTLAELAKFKGLNPGEPIYLAVNTNVFDVSQRTDLYGPGGAYENFGGRDATRGLCMFELNPVDNPVDISTLSPLQKESLTHWEKFFLDKYPLMGILKRTPEELEEAKKNLAKSEEKKKARKLKLQVSNKTASTDGLSPMKEKSNRPSMCCSIL